GTVVSTTSWFDRETDETEDMETFLNFVGNLAFGISVPPLESPVSTIEQYESLTHETRFTSSFEGNWQFTAGIFYADAEWDHEYPASFQVGLYDAAVAGFGEFGLPPEAIQDCSIDGPLICIQPSDLIFVTQTITKVEEIAVFGEVTYEFDERWSVTAGGRWYDTQVEATSTADGFANTGFTSYAAKQDESGFNPKIMAEMVLNDDMNFYASASKGFRVGGINGNLPLGLCGEELDAKNINPAETVTYDSDELWSYELGFKSSLANNRVTFNAAVYFIDWTDMQQQNRLGCGFQFVANAGEAESRGFEFELAGAITDSLTGTLGVGYTDAEITDTGDVPGLEKGDTILGVPDWTANGSLEYLFPMMGEWEGMLRADANYYGESTTAPTGDVVVRDDWSTLNLRAGMLNDSWEVIMFADNVTDERANLSDNRSIAANMPGRARVITNRPRTIGVEARLRF
ncbi:MAG: TonB-dependent receptor, partial [Proteobacteria bacterium]|nr:TonB-dependent receptor [Pseudomonadota bacterium]